jgi:uncharacterized membrane protein YeaQ/YmgE (transglycosylase-associated protein family)
VHFCNERIIAILLVGAAAGYLSSKVVRGGGFGIVGEACVGIVRGDWILPRFNFHLVAALWVWPSTRRSGQSCCRLFGVRSARADGATVVSRAHEVPCAIGCGD